MGLCLWGVRLGGLDGGMYVIAISKASTSDLDVAAITSPDVIADITVILGYDITASMAEGYQLMADEALAIAASTLPAGVETWPQD